MKWALLFMMFSGGADDLEIRYPEILKTFVSYEDCAPVRDEKRQRSREINLELERGKAPVVYIECVPYTGPWKQES